MVLEINGGEKSGSGTILRLAIALASILKDDLHIYNIRGKRSPPGLRPQHLEAVLTAAKLCNANVEGAKLGSRELIFRPSEIAGGKMEAEIGTAGSIPMLLLTILPICAFARQAVTLRVKKGGTDVRNAPTINYLRHVFLPLLGRMGLKASLTIHKYGYYPKGMGEVSLEVQPCHKLLPLRLDDFGKLDGFYGISVCTFLQEKRVAERQAKAAEEYLRGYGFSPEINILYDNSNPLQRGSSIVLWANTDKGALLGGDAIGELGKPSEEVGREAAENIRKELDAKATVDVHLADMLVPYVGLADEESIYLTRSITEHLHTNIWLTQKILGVKFHISKSGDLYRIEKRKC
ncbi:RNA 3'-terminal phosphate cyclase [Candidatus Bathyarchaeota archaeon]|nr:RNA 3'-terminal phosphate cyclase [Candidatus Bathyarchaeota archaeon]